MVQVGLKTGRSNSRRHTSRLRVVLGRDVSHPLEQIFPARRTAEYMLYGEHGFQLNSARENLVQ